MPLPLIPILIGAGAAALGIGKGAKAIHDNSEAKDINADAQSIINSARINLENARNTTKSYLEALGEKKIDICQKSLADFVKTFERIKNVELQDSTGLDELTKFKIDKASFSQLKEITVLAGSMAGGTAAGAVAGGAVAFGAYGAASVFATASTHTAIASLSGAAATNATLAFFGGGSLTAGGLGMVGGMWVLGGLVAGPALAVLGFVMGAKASANLDNAYSNLAKAREAEEQINVMVTVCNGIKERSELFIGLLNELDGFLRPMLLKLEDCIEKEGVDYRSYSLKTKQFIAALVSTVQAMKAMLDTPLLDEKGALMEESREIADSVNTFIATEQMDGIRQELGVKTNKTLTLQGNIPSLELIYVEPGSFPMGTSEKGTDARFGDAPLHTVTLTKGYWLGKYEVTQEQYEAIMGRNPADAKGAKRPVEHVSWDDAKAFCKNLNEMNAGTLPSGYEFDLPTEAQWEYACRAGTTTMYSWGNELNGDKANCDGTFPYGTEKEGVFLVRTTPVGSYLPNPWGFYDMHGNVWEWCRDWHEAYKGDATDPVGPAHGTWRVIRGGGLDSTAAGCGSAQRSSTEPTNDVYCLGFRVALVPIQ